MLCPSAASSATRRSETDTLSGLLNRRGFEERADRAVREAVRREGPLALVIADLDHFKSINDSYGHAAGDAVIAAFARFFAEGARSAFAALPVDGLPDDVRFTASFGVAELAPGETTRDLMRRADGALYEAKKAGRDCVRVSLAAGRLRPLTRAG